MTEERIYRYTLRAFGWKLKHLLLCWYYVIKFALQSNRQLLYPEKALYNGVLVVLHYTVVVWLNPEEATKALRDSSV